MMILLRENADPKQVEALSSWLRGQGFDLHFSHRAQQDGIAVLGDTGKADPAKITAWDVVAAVECMDTPYLSARGACHPEDTVVEAGGVKVGGGHFLMIAGPCSVESPQQITSVAQAVKHSGAHMLRGGAYKPRTSPYTFQGLHREGLELLLAAKAETGLPVITEIMDIGHLALFENVDVIQVGARNMQNFELLKELGKLRKPVLLKRGLANTLEELLMSAEYVLAGGNEQVILCERGIRTFETATRNTLDLSAVPVLHRRTHLPVVVDPSHGTGDSGLVAPMALAAAAAGADGLIIEVHDDPAHALSDGRQALTPVQFDALCRAVRTLLPYGAKVHSWA